MMNPADEAEIIKGSGSRYGAIGLEATVLFGDFKKKKSNKKKKK